MDRGVKPTQKKVGQYTLPKKKSHGLTRTWQINLGLVQLEPREKKTSWKQSGQRCYHSEKHEWWMIRAWRGIYFSITTHWWEFPTGNSVWLLWFVQKTSWTFFSSSGAPRILTAHNPSSGPHYPHNPWPIDYGFENCQVLACRMLKEPLGYLDLVGLMCFFFFFGGLWLAQKKWRWTGRKNAIPFLCVFLLTMLCQR